MEHCLRRAYRLRRSCAACRPLGLRTGPSSLGATEACRHPAALNEQYAACRPDAGPASIHARHCRLRSSSLPERPSEIVFLVGQAGSLEEARALIARYREADLDAVLAEVEQLLEGASWDGPGAHARQGDGHHVERLAALPDALLPHHGALCLLSGERRLRLPRSAAGRHGSDLRKTGDDSQTTCFELPRVSSSKAMFNIGGCPIPDRASAPAFPTTAYGSPIVWQPTSKHPETLRSSTRSSHFSTARTSSPASTTLFFQPAPAEESGVAVRALRPRLDQCLALTSERGLPLIGTGDWNDGMNRVGEAGRGDSVWLGWFLLRTLDLFAPFAERTRSGTREAMARTRCVGPSSSGAGSLGRRMVSARHLRRRNPSRLGGKRRMPDRFDCPILGRAIRRR